MKWSVRTIDSLGMAGLLSACGLGVVLLVQPSPHQPIEPSTAISSTAAEQSGRSVSSVPTPPLRDHRGDVDRRERVAAADDRRPHNGGPHSSRRSQVTPARSQATPSGTDLLSGDPGPQPITAAQVRRLAARAEQAAQQQTSGAFNPSSAPAGTVPSLPPAAGATSFTAASFNVLGAGHTAPGGNRPGWAPGVVRMRWAVDLLLQRDVEVVGFQEFQSPQAAVFEARTGAGWDAFPGLAKGQKLVQNSVAWRTDRWKLIEAHLVDVPYFFGRPFPMPYVLLQSRSTGQHVWVLNVHNPADARGDAAGFRARALIIETDLVNRLSATGVPVVFTGDLNDRAGALCAVVARAGMRSADGAGSAGGCAVPPGAGVDWIFTTSRVMSSNYARVRDGVVGRVSDHPLITATLTIPAR